MRRSLSFLERLKLYPLLIVSLIMIGGIITGSFFAFPYEVTLYSILALLLLALLSYKNLIIRYILLYVSVFLLGAVMYQRTVKEYTIGGESRQNIKAIIVSSPTQHGKVMRCDVVVANGRMAGRRMRTSIMRDTIGQRYRRLSIGTGIECDAFIAPPKDFGDGNFSYSRYLLCNGISATAFVPVNRWRFVSIPLSCLSVTDMLRLRASQYREKLISRYKASGLNDISLSLVSAMTLGERSMISKSVREEFSATGTSHVLAMSGLHLSIIYLFLTYAWGRRKKWVVVSLVNIILIWSFVFIAGLPTSLVRSAIMLTTYCVLRVLRYESQPLNTLSLAAFIIVLGNPMSVYDVGFQMSFMAVMGILTLVPWIMGRLGERAVLRLPALRVCISFIAVSCVAQLAVAPLIAYYFGRFSSYFLLANVVAIPCTYVILLCGMLLLLVPVAAFQGIVAVILNYVVDFMNKALAYVSSLPYATIDVNVGVWGVVITYVVIIALIVVAYKFTRTKMGMASF